ncbi:MAG: lysylphosphatidylglycerol synthase transmembrane domain-containing protein [Anaerolineales bacterium]|jgi:uncharacterized protein (TIRG00374 family)
MRRWLFWLLVIAFAWLVWTRYAEIQVLTRTLLQGQMHWILAAVVLQIVRYLIFAAMFQHAFQAVDVHSRVLDLMPLVFGSMFVNVVAPAGGSAGAALFVDDSARRGESPARTAAGTVMQLVADLLAITLILVAGMIYLFRQHHLQPFEVIGALLLVAITMGQSGILILGLWKPEWLKRLLNWFYNLSDWVSIKFRRQPLSDRRWSEHHAADFNQAARAIARRPAYLLRTLGIGLVSRFFDLACLYTLFLAFQQEIAFGPLVAGYAIGILFWIVSITPHGIGVVEGVMTLVYTSLEIPATRAAAVALTFRGLSFWIPFLIGFILLKRLNTFSTRKSVPQERVDH